MHRRAGRGRDTHGKAIKTDPAGRSRKQDSGRQARTRETSREGEASHTDERGRGKRGRKNQARKASHQQAGSQARHTRRAVASAGLISCHGRTFPGRASAARGNHHFLRPWTSTPGDQAGNAPSPASTVQRTAPPQPPHKHSTRRHASTADSGSSKKGRPQGRAARASGVPNRRAGGQRKGEMSWSWGRAVHAESGGLRIEMNEGMGKRQTGLPGGWHTAESNKIGEQFPKAGDC